MACGIVVKFDSLGVPIVAAIYSVSLTPKFPLTPSKCLSSAIFMACLQRYKLSFVISVTNLSFTPLPLASDAAFVMDSIPKGAIDIDLISAK